MSNSGKGINLLKNFGTLTIGQFSTKVLNFLLVPLYTYVLSTKEYGSYDFVSTVVSVLIPILTLNIYDGAGRYSIGEELDRKQVFSISLKWLIIATISCCLLALCLFLGLDLFGLGVYWHYLVMLFVVNALVGVLTIFVRGLEQIRTIAIAGVVGSGSIVGLNLLFLLVLGLGLDGYFLANIIGLAIQCIYIVISAELWRYITLKLDRVIERRMLGYSIPMITNTVSWWVNDLSDRLIVSYFCGLAANGIYAVAYKIPAIMNMITGVFSQAWTLSAVRDFDPADSDGFFKRSYDSYACLTMLACSFLILLDIPISSVMFSNEFSNAWVYVPPLLISAVFGALSGFIGAFFTAIEDAGSFARTAVSGAVANLTLNVVLVPTVGPMGAAVATAISSFLIWFLRIIRIRKVMLFTLSARREVVVTVILVLQSIIICTATRIPFIIYLVELLLFICNLYIYRLQLKYLYDKVRMRDKA